MGPVVEEVLSLIAVARDGAGRAADLVIVVRTNGSVARDERRRGVVLLRRRRRDAPAAERDHLGHVLAVVGDEVLLMALSTCATGAAALGFATEGEGDHH